MAELPESDWPDDPHDITVRIVRSDDPDEINEGLGRLKATGCVAQEVGRQRPVLARRDAEVEGGMFTHVALQLWKKKFDPDKAGERGRKTRFRFWLHTVVRNEISSLYRRRRSREIPASQLGEDTPDRPGMIETALDPTSLDDIATADAVLDGDFFLSDRDLGVIGGWDVTDRVLILSLANLWHRVPAERWAAWVAECGYAMPMPSQEFQYCDDPRKRIQPFAESIGMGQSSGPNKVSQMWLRKQTWLVDLEGFWLSVREKYDVFAADELDYVRSWTVSVRLILLTLSGHWLCMPNWAEWKAWQAEIGLRKMLPLLLLLRKPTLQLRMETLADKQPKWTLDDIAAVWRENRHLLTYLKPPLLPCGED